MGWHMGNKYKIKTKPLQRGTHLGMVRGTQQEMGVWEGWVMGGTKMQFRASHHLLVMGLVLTQRNVLAPADSKGGAWRMQELLMLQH